MGSGQWQAVLAVPTATIAGDWERVHLCAIGGLASKRARSGEGCSVLVDKCFERRRRPTTNRLDQVVPAGEDPVLVVDRDLAQVLDDESSQPHLSAALIVFVLVPGGKSARKA